MNRLFVSLVLLALLASVALDTWQKQADAFTALVQKARAEQRQPKGKGKAK
jgi:hypothetical protein